VNGMKIEGILIFSYLLFKGIFIFFSRIWKCKTKILGLEEVVVMVRYSNPHCGEKKCGVDSTFSRVRYKFGPH